MRPKVRDAYQAVRETVFARSKVSKKLNNLFKKDPNLVEHVFKQLNNDISWLKSKLKSKNEQKIKTLELKFLNEKGNQCPDHLKRFSDIKLSSSS